jgi:hypothetical protein
MATPLGSQQVLNPTRFHDGKEQVIWQWLIADAAQPVSATVND